MARARPMLSGFRVFTRQSAAVESRLNGTVVYLRQLPQLRVFSRNLASHEDLVSLDPKKNKLG